MQNPLWLPTAHLHRSLAQATRVGPGESRACTASRFCITLLDPRALAGRVRVARRAQQRLGQGQDGVLE